MLASNIPQPTEEIRLTEGQINEIRSLSEFCLSLTAIAALVGLPPAQMIQLLQHDERVKMAIHLGRAKAEKSIAEALFKGAIGGNVTAGIWLEKTRFGHIEGGRAMKSIEADVVSDNKELVAS